MLIHIFPQNFEECIAIVQLATIFQAQGKDFRIITPYDAQRSLIEEELKKAELEWGDKCFNVDSFQGKSISCTSGQIIIFMVW